MKFNNNSALIVIDMQNDGLIHKKAANGGNNADLIERVHGCIVSAKEAGIPIVNVLHTWKNTLFERLTKGNVFIEDTEGAKLHPDVFKDIAWDIEIGKSVGDAFSNAQLLPFLQSHGITELYIVGLDARFCVDATAQGAVNHGFKTTVFTDLVLTRDQANVMPKLIETYHQKGIETASFGEIEK